MVLFRCDSSYDIGSGHVLRSLRLAQRLRLLGHNCVFCCRDLPGNVGAEITKQNFPLFWLSTDSSIEAERSVILAKKPDWIVVDHYDLGADWEKFFQPYAGIFSIDDTAQRHHFCDALLDTNFRNSYQDVYDHLVPAHCRLLLGPSFSLLPPELARDESEKRFRQKNQHVLVFFGGTDPTGELLRFFHETEGVTTDLQFTLVATKTHKYLTEINSLGRPGCNIKVAPQDWHQLIRESDFYFGSSGSVTWERFFFGLPGAVITTADNQVQIAMELEKAGLQFYFGPAWEVRYAECISRLERIISDSAKLVMISETTKKLVSHIPDKVLAEIFKEGRHGEYT